MRYIIDSGDIPNLRFLEKINNISCLQKSKLSFFGPRYPTQRTTAAVREIGENWTHRKKGRRGTDRQEELEQIKKPKNRPTKMLYVLAQNIPATILLFKTK